MADGNLQLCLFVAGGQPSSEIARANLERALQDLGIDDGVLEIVDVMERPDRAWAEKVLATPALVRMAPEPQLRMVGTLDDADLLTRALRRGESGRSGRGERRG